MLPSTDGAIKPTRANSPLRVDKRGAGQLQRGGKPTMRLKLSQSGQNLIEYAIVVAVVVSAMVAMSTYVFRSVQSTQQSIQKEFADQ
jgi:Flp pilus assembly pilin Flp